jgi:hypothetical protein
MSDGSLHNAQVVNDELEQNIPKKRPNGNMPRRYGLCGLFIVHILCNGMAERGPRCATQV